MEPEIVDQPVPVLGKLPGEAGLSDPGWADYGHEPRPPLARGRVEEVLDQAELVVAAHERRLERLRAVAAADLGDDAERPPGRDRADLPLERLLPDRFEGDGTGRGALGRLPDENGAGGGHRLEPRGRVHQVARDHALVRGPERHGCLAGQDPGPGLDRRAEGSNGVKKLEGCPNCALGVILVGRWRAPDRRDRVPDELLDRPPVAPDHVPREVEVPREQLARLFGIPALGERREADQVREQDRYETALRDGCLADDRRADGARCRAGRHRTSGERRGALPAELLAGLVGSST